MDKELDTKQVETESVSIDDAQPVDNEQPATDTSVDEKDTIISDLTAKVTELNDKYLRAVAELENTRRRATLDIESRARNRAMGVAGKILPVMDAIGVALKHSPDDEGIKSMAQAMESAFAQIGITKIESIGQTLNPQFHNAIQAIDAPADVSPHPAPNTILEEMQAGYMYGDSILRPAMVIVCK